VGVVARRRREALVNWETFSNSRSDILEIIKSGFELPSGVVMFEDPPAHTMHRGSCASSRRGA
jgi:hypothetical protein